jgi:hypothetical protein
MKEINCFNFILIAMLLITILQLNIVFDILKNIKNMPNMPKNRYFIFGCVIGILFCYAVELLYVFSYPYFEGFLLTQLTIK